MVYYTLWTEIGLNKRAQFEMGGPLVNITQMAVGDGNGSQVAPEEQWTALVNEVWRGSVNIVALDPDNGNWVTVEGKIPMTIGGWHIREVGLFDADGDMVAVGNYPATYKPILSEGAGADLYIRSVLVVDNASAIQLSIEPDIVMASKAYVDGIAENLETLITASRRRAFFFANTI